VSKVVTDRFEPGYPNEKKCTECGTELKRAWLNADIEKCEWPNWDGVPCTQYSFHFDREWLIWVCEDHVHGGSYSARPDRTKCPKCLEKGTNND